MEALIGAIHDDGGLEEARLFIDRVFFEDRRFARALSQGDSITELKELCERKKIPYIYREEKKTVNGKTLFFVYLQWQGKNAVGIGKNKKEAERRASGILLH